MPSEHTLRTAADIWSPDRMGRHRWHAWLQLLMPRLAGFGANFALRHAGALEQRLRDAFGQCRLEDGPTLLRISATDAATGDAVVLGRGRVVDALLATLAAPFLFAPVAIGERRLMDGMLSDPLPVAAAADARVVIALGFANPLPPAIDSAPRLLTHVGHTLVNNLMQARSAAARAAGQRVLRIEPALERTIGSWDVDALRYSYEAGRRAARAQLPQIAALLEGRTMRVVA
jgi:NTE family protein